jgi:hypothetical protein
MRKPMQPDPSGFMPTAETVQVVTEVVTSEPAEAPKVIKLTLENKEESLVENKEEQVEEKADKVEVAEEPKKPKKSVKEDDDVVFLNR